MKYPVLKHGVIRLSAYLALTALYGLSFCLLILQDNATHAQDHPPLDWRSLEEPRIFSDIQPHFDLQAVTFDAGTATATQVQPGCPTFASWDARTELSEQQLVDHLQFLEENAMRPISVSATGGALNGDVLFDITSIADEFGDPSLWSVDFGLLRQSVLDQASNDPDFRPVALDAYATLAGVDYIVAWVADGHPVDLLIGGPVPPLAPETLDCDYAARGSLSIWSRRNWAGER